MRHTIIAAAVLGAAVLSTGCSSSSGERAEAGGSSTSTMAPTSSSASTPTVVDLEFISALDKVPVMYGSETDIIAIGHKVCAARQHGVSEGDVIATIMNSSHYGYIASEAIVEYAEKYYCSQFSAAAG